MTKAYVTAEGAYLMSFDGDVEAPDGAVEVPSAPQDIRQLWDFDAEEWGAVPPPPPPQSVSARQFKLQLLAAGLLDQVEAWIASQDQAVQIAYEASGMFVRSEPMMQAGFTALGFTTAQIDAFFTSAALL